MPRDQPDHLAVALPRHASDAATDLRSRACQCRVAAAAAVALLMVQLNPPAPASAVAITLCGGGVVHLALGGKAPPGDPPSACHAACALRRDDDDRDHRFG